MDAAAQENVTLSDCPGRALYQAVERRVYVWNRAAYFHGKTLRSRGLY